MSLRDTNYQRVRALFAAHIQDRVPELPNHPELILPPDEIVVNDEVNPKNGCRLTYTVTVEGILDAFGLEELPVDIPITPGLLRQIDPDDQKGYKKILEDRFPGLE